MRLPRFATTTIVTFLLVVILNADFGFIAQLPGARQGINWQFLPQTQVLAQTPEQQKAQADQLLEQGIQQFDTSQFEAALQSWQGALIIYQKINDRQGEGAALGNLGIAYESLRDYTKAINYQQQRLVIAREIGDQLGEGQSLGNLGNTYNSLGEYTKAIEYYQQSLVIFREIKDRKGEGQSLRNLGNPYSSLGDYAKAIEYFQQSLALVREINDRHGEVKSLLHLGNAYYYLGDYTTAIDYAQQSLAIARELKERDSEWHSLDNLGLAYQDVGDYAKAIEYFQQSLSLAREIQDRHGEGQSLGNLGATYHYLRDYYTAINYQMQSLAIAREINDYQGEGDALGNLGLAYRALGDYAKAIEYAQQSLAIAQEIKDRHGEAASLDNLGLAYNDLGDYPKAIAYHQQSLSIARELKDRNSEGGSLTNLGNVYYALEDYPKAIEYFQQSLGIKQKIGDKDGEGIALSNLGLALYKLGNLTAAEANLIEGIKVYESIRDKLGSNDNNKVSIFEIQASTYRFLQQVLIAQNKTETALEISERGRARAFVELLASRLSPNSAEPVTIAPPTIAQLKQTAKDENATLVEYSIIYNIFKIQDQQKIKESELYIWVIKPTGEITFRKTDLQPLLQEKNISLSDLVYISRQAIGVRGLPIVAVRLREDVQKQQGENLNQKLQQLHQILIQPIADLLPTNPESRVIFMPQGELFLVPFPALKDTDGKYLIEKHTILTSPAIQVLQLTRTQKEKMENRERVESGAALVVGNPTMPSVPPDFGKPPEQLPSLPGAELEAKAIAPLLNTQALTGNQATKSAVIQKMPNARIIHFATHGLLDDIRGLGSAIALAPDSPSSPLSQGGQEGGNGLLTAEEILDLKLNAELVILSACNTGRGKITGDGVVGLSRSFISAGVPSIIVSLWSVPDAPTGSLMTEFYQNMQNNLDKAQALRQAILTTKDKYPNPKDWAAFTLIGEAK